MRKVKRRREEGFTLVEMMVVIVIIGVIASIAIQQYVSHAARAKRDASQAILAEVSQAIDLFKLRHNRFPAELRDLVRQPAYVDPTDWPGGGYLKRFPKDAWKNEFVYREPGTGGQPFDLISLGEDGREGGEALDKDLWNHEAFE